MLPKMRAYVKTYDGESRWMTFLIKDNLIKYDIGIKSVKVLKKNLNENPSSIIFFENQNKVYGDEATDVGYSYTYRRWFSLHLFVSNNN